MSQARLWTFGHSTRSAAETVALLRGAGIGCVVDVRSIRGSRHNPQFNVEEMTTWLADAGIGYRWIEQLGGRRRNQGVDPAINGGWRNGSFHHYADYTLSDEFEEGMGRLAGLASARPSAIMCAEAVPWRCHRSLIATVATVRGWEVRHLLGGDQCVVHQPGRWGATPRIGADGAVTYPLSGDGRERSG